MADKYDFIKAQHPVYKDYAEEITMHIKCYNDSKDWVGEKTLYKHTGESGKKYDARKLKSTHLNLYKYLINLHFKSIYSDKVTIVRTYSGGSSFVIDNYVDNIDLQGNSIDQLMQYAGILALIAGQSYIAVDRDNDLQRSYCRVINPLDVENWSIDKYGNYEWVKIKLKQTTSSDYAVEPTTQDVYLYYTKTNVTLYDKDGKQISDTPHNLGVVPVIKVALKDSNFDGWGDPLRELYEIDKALLNVMNLYLHEFFINMFNMLVLPQGSLDKDDTLKISESSIIVVPDDNKIDPKFLSPNTNTFAEKREMISLLIAESLRITGFKGREDSFNKSGRQSAMAKSYDFVNSNETLLSVCQKLEKTEKQLFFLLALFDDTSIKLENATEFRSNLQVLYPREFDILALGDEIENLYRLSDADISSTASKEAKKAIVNKLLISKCSQNTINQIMQEIDNGETTNNGTTDVQTTLNEEGANDESI